MKKNKLTMLIILMITSMLISTISSGKNTDGIITTETDLDPLVDVVVTVEIQKIRSLEKTDFQIPSIEKIDWFSDPDFFVKVFINDVEFKSTVWHNTKYIYNPQWSATLNVPDDKEFVNITIQLWDWNPGINKLCDISTAYSDGGPRDSCDVELRYSIKSGHWYGDDSSGITLWSGDVSGYGRLNGCDDGSIYQRDRDCELWFDIYQNDYDGDGIPYWSEVNHHKTDPEVDNRGEDLDEDGIPIEWENKWGHYMGYDWHEEEYYHVWLYDDLNYNDHKNFDPDSDGIDNLEEFKTSQWGSDPFREDIFIELDQMETSPSGELSILPEESKEELYTVFNRRNMVLHIDDGSMGGGEMIPFDDLSTYEELRSYFYDYFLHGDEHNWRRSVFHYGLLVYNAQGAPGYIINANTYQISSKGMEEFVKAPFTKKDIVYASAYLHELGHTFGFNPIGGHDQISKYPWQLGWWKWRPYKSVMNYGYMYFMVDYSDGSRQKNDFDDWDRMDLTWFENQWF